jgi:hypothetical protein
MTVITRLKLSLTVNRARQQEVVTVTDALDAPVKRRNRNKFVQLGKGLLWTVAFLQLFILAPSFSGEIARREESLYVWDGYVEHLHRFGTADAIFSSVWCILYYAFISELAYVILSALLKPDRPMDKPEAEMHRVVVLYCSLWALFTFLTFGDSIFQFIRSVPTEKSWLIILWVCSTIVAMILFWKLFDKKRNERKERLEQRIDERWRETLCHNFRLEQSLFKQWLDSLCHPETSDTSSQAREPTYEELLQRLKELDGGGSSKGEA